MHIKETLKVTFIISSEFDLRDDERLTSKEEIKSDLFEVLNDGLEIGTVEILDFELERVDDKNGNT